MAAMPLVQASNVALNQQEFINAFGDSLRTEQQERLWNSARSFLGAPYVYAGNTRQGTDCSGYTSTIYSELGKDIPRSAQEQWAVGIPVSQEELILGDLVFFGQSDRNVTHVGVYLGEGKFSHAALSTRSVRVETLAPMLGNIRYLGARRMLPSLADNE